MESFLDSFWPHIVVFVVLAITVLASFHVVLNKKDTSSAAGWIGLIVVAPMIGAVLYLCLGINRIRRVAKVRRQSVIRTQPTQLDLRIPPERHVSIGGSGKDYLAPLSRLVERVTSQPLLEGNDIVPLTTAEEAYTAMLLAIDGAEKSITLCTYIFDNDEIGARFLESLRQARRRAVEVRILIDAIGARYSFPPIVQAIRRSGLPVASFMPTRLPWRFPYSNLRNHRKIMVIDGRHGFTGGMNIQSGPTTRRPRKRLVQDLHFKVRGPVVRQLQEAFFQDWFFSTHELLKGDVWFPRLEKKGTMAARGILDGPDEDFEKIRWVIMGAIASAQESLTVVTPYFLPDATLNSLLCVAALRGVKVTVLVPEVNNLMLVQWASMDNFRQLLEHGVRVFRTDPQFDHTKIMLVDRMWVLLGSANWDPRSLRLNFEFNVECYDENLAQSLTLFVDQKLANARELTLETVNTRPLPIRLRDGLARLFSPYL